MEGINGNLLSFVAGALALDELHIKRAIMVWPACFADWPLTGAIAVAVSLAKERHHRQ